MGILWKTRKTARPMGNFLCFAGCGYFLDDPPVCLAVLVIHRFSFHIPQEHVENSWIFMNGYSGHSLYIYTDI